MEFYQTRLGQMYYLPQHLQIESQQIVSTVLVFEK